MRVDGQGEVAENSPEQGPAPRPRRPAPELVLQELAAGPTGRGMDREEWLTWVLRPHKEVVLGPEATERDRAENADVTLLRRQLDDALDALTAMEIRLQCRAPDGDRPFQFSAALQAPLCVLAQSEAFLRYLDAYRFFGVRFLLGRDEAVRDAWRAARDLSISLPNQLNRPVLPLEAPPVLQLEDAQYAQVVGVVEALGEPLSMEEQEALLFLNGFYQKLSSGTGAAEMHAGKAAEAVAADAAHAESSSVANTHDLELWLRGMLPGLQPGQESLPRIAQGLQRWATNRARRYDALGEAASDRHGMGDAPAAPWTRKRPDTPQATRVALMDLYWLAGVLRAEVTPFGQVTYERSSWLSLLSFRTRIGLPMHDGLENAATAEWPLERVEGVLRSVFSATCELVQNAAEKAEARNRQEAGHKPPLPAIDGVKDWRDVFDDELGEIERQRNLRTFNPVGERKHDGGAGDVPRAKAADKVPGWSRRLFTGGHPRDLVGLAFSGGGIRSATFNLGVLQGLQELDLLRQVDYLSTVSGGGFIGSWLLGNVKRTRYWLTRLTPWEESIARLRTYSNYLAPRSGVFSMDTWSLGTLWLRNTLLIQLSTLAWLLLLLTGVYGLRLAAKAVLPASFAAFRWLSFGSVLDAVLLSAGISVGLAVRSGLRYRQTGGFLSPSMPVERQWFGWPWTPTMQVLLLAVVPAWLGAALLAERLYAMAIHGTDQAADLHYGTMLRWELSHWTSTLVVTAIALSWLAGTSLLAARQERRMQTTANGGTMPGSALSWKQLVGAILTGVAATAVLHLCLAAIVYALRLLHRDFPLSAAGIDVASFTVGPPLILLAYSQAILLLIGLLGSGCNESQREWWTRYGGWILIASIAWLLLPGLAFGGPWLLHHELDRHAGGFALPSALGAWLLSTLGSLFAGKSSKTSGEPTSKSISLDWIARIGSFVFLVGAALGAAEMLYQLLRLFLPENLHPVHVGGTIVDVPASAIVTAMFGLLLVACLFSLRFEINIFGLNQMYRNRLVRCYLGATRWMPGMRSPDRFTRFDFNDELDLHQFTTADAVPFRGPFPILNCSLNLAGSGDLALHTRHSASFSLTPLYCGADRPKVRYARTENYAGSVGLGEAVSVSGAAASPNMGYNTSPLVAFLLTMFNVRLGWWFPNPSRNRRTDPSLRFNLGCLFRELVGQADESRAYLNISDGGHFENLGIYELVRRGCTIIIVGDAECDEVMAFGGLANAMRLCETDFGAVIDIDVSAIRRQSNEMSRSHATVGTIRYSNGSIGHLIYLKSSMTGDEDPTVAQYRAAHPTFPHETTADQFFSEDQFESYRRLGRHVVRKSFRCATPGEHLVDITRKMSDMAAPTLTSTERFLQHSKRLDDVWEHLREQAKNAPSGESSFLAEVLRDPSTLPAPPPLSDDVTAIGVQMLQLMEDVFVDLRLDDSWDHPDNRGWAMLFLNWARSPRFQQVWAATHRTFGIRFEYFCANRLGLIRDHPVLRVTS